jgi:HK97 family phage major capsid protein
VRSGTATPDIFAVTPTGGELHANPQLTQNILEDAVLNLEEFIQVCVVDELARAEGAAFVSGDGTNKPKGFLTGTPVATADASRAFGTLQYLPSGNASTLGTTPIDTLMTMIFSMKAKYRNAGGCAWLMSTAVLSVLSGLKDTTGRPIYAPSYRDGMPGVLLGYPVYECEDMSAITANTFPVAFGNWQRGYIIGDRTPLSMLRDPYTNKPYVGFYLRKRVYGGIYNSEAIKLLKVAVS